MSMELKLLEKEKEHIKVEVEAVDESIIYLFISEVLKNEEVEEATYSKDPRGEDKYTIFVRVKKGRPITAMKKAAESLSEEFKQCEQHLQKELKSSR